MFLWVYMQVLWTRWWGFFSFFRQFEDYVVDDIRGPHLLYLLSRTIALVAELAAVFWAQLCWVIPWWPARSCWSNLVESSGHEFVQT
jgi:hypothetical protein